MHSTASPTVASCASACTPTVISPEIGAERSRRSCAARSTTSRSVKMPTGRAVPSTTTMQPMRSRRIVSSTLATGVSGVQPSGARPTSSDSAVVIDCSPLEASL